MQSTRYPIPKLGKKLPRDADFILETLENDEMRHQASAFFGCFRYARTGTCPPCPMHQINVLHSDGAPHPIGVRTPPPYRTTAMAVPVKRVAGPSKPFSAGAPSATRVGRRGVMIIPKRACT